MMNKKADTFGGWIEIILFLTLFLGVIAFMGADLNQRYGQNNDLTLGLNLSSSSSSLKTFQHLGVIIDNLAPPFKRQK